MLTFRNQTGMRRCGEYVNYFFSTVTGHSSQKEFVQLTFYIPWSPVILSWE
jgi:hypothetical protein